ncbi:hypothetical protein, partial [Candidatus Liberibacter sp.]|uniref:hypothetical protein n=1 Tax=Candidatus Liberibacter sp. TaxID=34022 RepID=UPI0015F3A4DC
MTQRYGVTENNPPEQFQFRRYVKGTPRIISALVDNLYDQTNTSVDILKGYAMSAIKGMNLAQDRMVIKGIFGTNFKDDGTSTQEFDTSMMVPLTHGVNLLSQEERLPAHAVKPRPSRRGYKAKIPCLFKNQSGVFCFSIYFR